MAKTEKVKNRKLRRRVRRTSAIILLITSIIVAAIPVPENTAAPVGGARAANRPPDDPTRTVDAYTYPDDTRPLPPTDTNSSTLNLTGTGVTTKEAFSVVESGGQYIYQWQFKYYTDTDKNTPSVTGNEPLAIVKEYNPTYSVPKVDMSAFLYLGYEVIEPDIYEKVMKEIFDTTSGNNILTVTSPDMTGCPQLKRHNAVSGNPAGNVSSYEILKKYFPEEWAAYETEHNTWKANFDKDPATAGPEPSHDFDLINLQTQGKSTELYCDLAISSYNSVNSLSGFKLQKVTDRSQKGPDGDDIAKEAYIPKAVEGAVHNPDVVTDANGFTCDKKTPTIVAIANNAFKGIHNVDELILPVDVKFIGENAFEDSFIQKLTASGLIGIGDGAFRGCNNLSEVAVKGEGRTSTLLKIGTEAFRANPKLTSFEVPNSVNEIGPGAFAFCNAMNSLTFQTGGHSDCGIGDYAFYNCMVLSNVDWGSATSNITKIGKAAFAVSAGGDSMKEFRFPEGSPDKGITLGDCILAGRGSLENVTLPSASWGRAQDAELPEKTFLNCYSLGYVEFPDDGKFSCGYVIFGEHIFDEVANPDLYVRGPMRNAQRQTAGPRKSTWETHSVGKPDGGIPYVYKDDNGKDCYEVCDGKYLLAIDEDGILQSCTFRDPDNPENVDIVVPNKVGNIVTTGIASGSFDKDTDAEKGGIKQYITSLVFEDDSKITTIEDGVFSGCPLLESVVIGNTIKSIGANAFANCGKLDTSSFIILRNVFIHTGISSTTWLK